MKKLIFSLVLVFVAVLLYGGNYLSDVLRAGSGFSAKLICSNHFLSGMTGEQVVDEALVTASPYLSNISYEIDTENQLVDARLFGLFERRAVFTKGTGCTLLRVGRDQLNRRLEAVEPRELDPSVLWPRGSAPGPANTRLEPVLEQAFSEPDPQYARNTKAVVVVHEGQLIAEKYAPGIDARTPLPGWSMTKSVTNLLVGLLMNDGKLRLTQTAPVRLWQEDFRDPRGDITIDQLLRMSSGLEFNEEYGFHSDVTRMLALEASASGFAASKPLVAEPGSTWSYSSGTSNILAGVIRWTVGGYLQEYYEFTQERLFLPLGIHTATLETDNNGTFVGSSFMYASARDWARLGQFCLQEGRWRGQELLPEGWIKYSTTPTANNPLNNYGAHFWLNADPKDSKLKRTWPSLPPDTYSMNGYQGQRVIIIPSKELVVVRLGFSNGPDRGIEQLVSAVIDIVAPERKNQSGAE